MIPLVFILMTKKSEKAYQKVFEYVNKELFDMKCASFMTDFEKAMRSALHSVVPGVPCYGCWFHYSQALRRRVGTDGLTKFLKTNKEALVIYKKLRFLALLPAAKISEGFNILKQEALDLHHDQFNSFVKYVFDQWITKVSVEFGVRLIVVRSIECSKDRLNV